MATSKELRLLERGRILVRFGMVVAGLGIIIGLLELPGQTRVDPKQISGSGQVTVMVCAPSTPAADCSGLIFVDLVRPDGSHLTAIGGPAPAGFVPDARWVTVVPAPAGQ